MNTKHVKAFIHVAEHGSFSEAANALFTTQSTLSKHIQTLEGNLGVKLFNRSTRSVHLSEEGKLFLRFARQLIETERSAFSALNEYKQTTEKTLAIGILPVASAYNIHCDIIQFQSEHPQINIHIIEANGNRIESDLNENKFDMVFYDDFLFENNPDIEQLGYCQDHFVALVNYQHPLATEPYIHIQDLRNEPLLLFDKTTPYYQKTYKLCTDQGFEPHVYFAGVRMENILELATLNMGIGIVMKAFADTIATPGLVIKELIPTDSRRIVLARHRQSHLSKEAKLFWDYITSLTS